MANPDTPLGTEAGAVTLLETVPRNMSPLTPISARATMKATAIM